MAAPRTRVSFGGATPTKRLGRKEPKMIIIGADYHPGFQQIAWVPKPGVERGATGTPRGGGKVLSRTRGRGNEGAGGDGSEWATRAGLSDCWRSCNSSCRWDWGGDLRQADTEAENAPPGCPADSALATRRSLSTDLGSEWGVPVLRQYS